jgi:hypothetical protein
MSELLLTDAAERADLADFIARVVRLDQAALVRLRGADGRVQAWAETPFEVLATRTARGAVSPRDITVHGIHLLAALAVARAERVDPGTPADSRWRSALPPDNGWRSVAEVPGAELEELAERGLRLARAGGADSVLDRPGLTLGDPVAETGRVPVPMRCLFALSGLGLLDDPEPVLVTATPSWVRLDARAGAVLRRRQPLLSLVSVG